jgi:hypothetical protein
MSFKVSLDQFLLKKNSELYIRLQKIKSQTASLFPSIGNKYSAYSIINYYRHGENIIENLNWLLLDNIKEKLNEYEVFFLITASWLHNWDRLEGDTNH